MSGTSTTVQKILQLKKMFFIRTDRALASILKTDEKEVKSWREVGTINNEIVKAAIPDINLNWLNAKQCITQTELA